MNLLMTLLQISTKPAPSFMEQYGSIMMMVLMVVVFYFFMIRPQQKKQKALDNFRKNLKEGDSIITAGGIYGKIRKVEDNHVMVEVADKMVVKLDKAMVATLAN